MNIDPSTAEDLQALHDAHQRIDWLLAAYLCANHGAMPSKTSVIDLMGWSLRKQKELAKALAKDA